MVGMFPENGNVPIKKKLFFPLYGCAYLEPSATVKECRMKKLLLIACWLLVRSLGWCAPFTPGNIVVVRIGTGTATMVAGEAQPVFLDEYTPTGVLVQSIALPTAVTGSNKRLTLPISTADYSEGYISLSPDRQKLVVCGYDADVNTASVSTTASSTTRRVVGVINANGNVNTSTNLNTFNTVVIRSATMNGNDIWVTGGNGGIMYTTLGGTTFTVVAGTTGRCLDIYDGQLYATSAATGLRMTSVGTGLPTTTGQTLTNFSGYPTNGSTYQFFMADMNASEPGLDVLYTADNNLLRKYSKVSGTWVTNGTIGVNADRYRGLTGYQDAGGHIVLYAARKNDNISSAGGELVSITDNTGYNADFTSLVPKVIVQAGANTVFRGVSMAPATTANTKVWLGNTSGDWATGDNWTGQNVPLVTSNVYIPANASNVNAPILGSGSFNISSLSIAGGVTFTTNTNSILNITGSLENRGTVAGNGKISLNGGAGQAVYGEGTYSNLEINNATGVSLNDAITITGTLTPTTGTLALNDFDITLASSGVATARIAATNVATPFAYGAGRFVVQRYIPGGQRAFRFFGHPFNESLSLAHLTDDIIITGNSSGGFTPTATNNPSAFWYDPLSGDENPLNDIGWTPFTTVNGNGTGNAWSVYKGIRVLVRGNIADGISPVTPSPVVLDVRGKLNTGTQTISLAKGTNSGFNFVANPFPSPVNLNTSASNVVLGSNVANNFYVWNLTAGTKGVWENVSFNVDYVLPAMSAFVIKTSANDQIQIKEAAKSGDALSGNLFRQKKDEEYFQFSVKDAAGICWDKFQLWQHANAQNTDDKYDGLKMINPEVNLFSKTANEKQLSIDTRSFEEAETIIPLIITSVYNKQLLLSVDAMPQWKGVEILLHDKLTKQLYPLHKGYTHSFDISNTMGNTRFELVVRKSTIAAEHAIASLLVYPNPAKEKIWLQLPLPGENVVEAISLTTMSGAIVKTMLLPVNSSGLYQLDVSGLKPGSYTVTVRRAERIYTQVFMLL